MPDQQSVRRADFSRPLSPVCAPASVPPPGRLWADPEWAAIRSGHRSQDMDDRWHALVENDRLYLHRSWTGHGIYEAQFDKASDGWRIIEAIVAGDGTTYRRGNDTHETLMLEWLIAGVLLGNWDDDLWQCIQQHGGGARS